MDTVAIAKAIHDCTNGYPFLVSRICQLLDENVASTTSLQEVWTRRGIDEAVKLLLAENNTLFQSLTKTLNNYPELKRAIRSVLMEGTRLAWNAQQDDIVQMQTYELIRNDNNTVRIEHMQRLGDVQKDRHINVNMLPNNAHSGEWAAAREATVRQSCETAWSSWGARTPNYAHRSTVCVIRRLHGQPNWSFSKNYAQ